MFSWQEYGRLKTTTPFKDLLREVRDKFEELGETHVEARDELSVDAKRYNGFGYDAKMLATLEEGENGEYDLKVRYELAPNALCILCLLFWPILLIVLLNGSSTKNRMRQDINGILEELEEKYGRGRRDE